jgi:hypothetical protein
MTGYELHGMLWTEVPAWHITRQGDSLGLCGKLLPPDAEVRPITTLDQVPEEWRCAACWTAYRAAHEPDGPLLPRV